MNATHRSPSSDRARRRAREAAPPIAVSPRDDASRRLVRSIDATLVWLDDAPLATASTWLVALGERTVRAHFAAMARADDLASPLVDASDRRMRNDGSQSSRGASASARERRFDASAVTRGTEGTIGALVMPSGAKRLLAAAPGAKRRRHARWKG